MKRKPNPAKFKFTLEALANFICEYIEDGKRTRDCDVVAWFRWFQKKCGLKESYIASTAELLERKYGKRSPSKRDKRES